MNTKRDERRRNVNSAAIQQREMDYGVDAQCLDLDDWMSDSFLDNLDLGTNEIYSFLGTKKTIHHACSPDGGAECYPETDEDFKVCSVQLTRRLLSFQQWKNGSSPSPSIASVASTTNRSRQEDNRSETTDQALSKGGNHTTTSHLPEIKEDFRIRILGGSESVVSHQVLSLPAMEVLSEYLPLSLQKENFWLKYSMLRDGASMETLLNYVQAATNTILAIETMDGHVFGCYTSCTWQRKPNFFGNGNCFLWRISSAQSTLAEKPLVDVYPCTGYNALFQLCNNKILALGGGTHSASVPSWQRDHAGFGLAIHSDLQTGTSSPCATFHNPCLAPAEVFEIFNIEMWTLTPCGSVDAAERLEMAKFLLSPAGSALKDKRLKSQQSFYCRIGQ